MEGMCNMLDIFVEKGAIGENAINQSHGIKQIY